MRQQHIFNPAMPTAERLRVAAVEPDTEVNE